MHKLFTLIKVAKKNYISDKDLDKSSNPNLILRNALVSRINYKRHKLTPIEEELASKLKISDKKFDDLLSRITTSKALGETSGLLLGSSAGYGIGSLVGSSLGAIVVPPPLGPITVPLGAMIGASIGSFVGGTGGKNTVGDIRDIYAQKQLDLLNKRPSGFQDKKSRGIKNNK